MGLGLNETLRIRGVLPDYVALSTVGLIAPDPCLLPMQQLRQHLAVMHIGRRRRHRMTHVGAAVHVDMRLHAIVPLLPFLGLVHLGIPLLGTILRRTGRTDNGGIHDGAAAHLQPLFRQRLPDSCKELLAQLVSFQQMSKLANRGLIGHGLATQINPHELPHGT